MPVVKTPMPAERLENFHQLASYYDAAVDQWRALHGDDDPAFWELDFDHDCLDITALSRLVAPYIERHSVSFPRAVSAYLFVLLRTQVSDVHGGRLWPAVAAVIARQSGSALDVSKVGAYFRSILARQYSADLSETSGKKYLALCFDQAGVGTDRTKLVKRFFKILLDAYEVAGNYDRRFVIDRLERFERTNPSDQIEPLQTVLERSGLALLNLAALFEQGLAGALLIDWNWASLRAEYKRCYGSDLQRLMPEAQEVFQEIYPSLQRVMRRDLFEALIESGKVSPSLPGGLQVHNVSKRSQLPLGQALLYQSGREKPVEIVDEHGVSAEQYSELEANKWISKKGSVYYTSENPFQVVVDGYQRSQSFPVFVGKHFSSQKLALHAWSNLRFPRAHSLEVPGSQDVFRRSFASIQVRSEWRLIKGSLVLRLLGFTASLSAPYERLELRYNSKTLWTGKVCSSSAPFVLSQGLNVDLPTPSGIDKAIELEFWDAELAEVVSAAVIPALADQPFFIVDDCRIFTPKEAFKLGGKSEVLLLTPANVLVTSVSAALVEERSDISALASLRQSHIKACGESLGASTVALSNGSVCRFGTPPSVIAPSATSVAVGDALISTGGNITVCRDLSDLKVSIANCRDLNGLSFRIGYDDQIFTLEGSGLSGLAENEREIKDVVCLKLGRLLSRQQQTIGAGVSTLEIGFDGQFTDPTYILYGETAQILPSKFQERSKLEIGAGETTFLFAGEPDDPLEVKNQQCSCEVNIDARTSFTISWAPKIRDAVFVSDGQILEPNRPISLQTLELDPLLTGFGFEAPAIVEIPGKNDIALAAGDQIPLSHLIASRSPLSEDFKIQVSDHSKNIRSFRLGAAIEASTSEALVSKINSIIQVARLLVRGVIASNIELHFEMAGRAITPRLGVAMEPESASIYRYEGPVQLPVLDAVDLGQTSSDDGLELVLSVESTVVRRQPVIPVFKEIKVEPQQIDENDISGQIRLLVTGLLEEFNAEKFEAVVLLFDRALARQERAPYDPERICASVTSAHPNEAFEHVDLLFHLLAQAYKQEPSEMLLPVPETVSQISVIYASFALLNDVRLDERGLRSPENTRALIEFLISAGERSVDVLTKTWCGHVIARSTVRFADIGSAFPLSALPSWVKETTPDLFKLQAVGNALQG